jgi:hypothetical protein
VPSVKVELFIVGAFSRGQTQLREFLFHFPPQTLLEQQVFPQELIMLVPFFMEEPVERCPVGVIIVPANLEMEQPLAEEIPCKFQAFLVQYLLQQEVIILVWFFLLAQ